MADEHRARAEKIDRTFGEWLLDSSTHPGFTLADAIETALRAVEREEREACAKVADRHDLGASAAIRARTMPSGGREG